VRRFLRIGGLSVGLFVAYCALLGVPQPLFSYSVRADGVTLHSYWQSSQAAAERVLERFHLLVAYLPDQRGWTATQLLESPPPQDAVEKD